MASRRILSRYEKVDWNKQEIEPGTLSRPDYHQGAQVDIRGDDVLVEMSRAPEPKSQHVCTTSTRTTGISTMMAILPGDSASQGLVASPVDAG
jgi:hypothetical protein